MELIYYLSIILFTIGLPAMLIYIILGIFKPSILQKFTKQEWSRKKIGAVGATSLLVGFIGLSLIIDATMPTNVRANIAAQRTREKDEQVKKLAEEKQAQKEALAKQPIVKKEAAISPINYTSSEQQDASSPKGERKPAVTGVNGEKTDTYEVTFINGKQISRKLIKSEVTKQPINEVIRVGTYEPPVVQSPAPQPTYSTPTGGGYYSNCSEARAAGVAPLYQGAPGYRPGLDRDHDGIACE